MTTNRFASVMAVAAAIGITGSGLNARAQTAPPDPSAHAQHAQHQSQPPAGAGAQEGTQALVDQIAELRAKIARLEAALAQGHARPVGAVAPPQGPAMPMDPRMQRRMGTGQVGATAMQPSGAGGMQGMGGGMPMTESESMTGGGGGMPMMETMMGGGMMDKMMGGRGMQMMGGMGPMNQAAMTSALPGFPGATHIYHVGATGFFLDHPEHISLTVEQQTRLNQLKEAAMLEQSSFDRRIGQAEQDLWVLTGSDTPDAGKIEAKAREIEKLRAEQRIAFIRAVGNAATVLTDEQRKQLTGMLPPDPTQPDQPMQPQGAETGAMGDM